MNIFYVKDGVLTFHQEIVRNIPEFYTIIKKRLPTKGDSEGREKLMNTKILMFVFYVAEFRDINPLSALPKEQRIEKAIEFAGLPEDWNPDKDVQAAVNRYIEIMTQLAPSVKLLSAAKQGISQAGDQILIAVEQNEQILKKIKTATDIAFAGDIADPEYGRKLEALQTMSNMFQGNIKELRATIKDLNNMHTTVEEFERTVAQQVEENLPIYGGGILNPRELPPSQRKNTTAYVN